MNYDQDRPSSRVICPPGGASSNIFGPPTVQTTNQKRNPISSIFNNDPPTEQVPKKSNPPGGKTHDVFGTQCSPETRKNVRASNSLKSTIFSNPEPQKTAQPNVQEKYISKTCQSTVFKPDEVKPQNPATNTFKSTAFNFSFDENPQKNDIKKPENLSEVPMFNGDMYRPYRPTTAPHTRCNGQVAKSSIDLNNCNYGNPAHIEPGLHCRPRTASKPVWHQDDNDKEDEENKRPKQENKPAPEPEVVKNHEPHLGPVKTTSGVKIRKPPGGGSSLTLG